ncbi:MAG: hypothetical protein PUD59_03805 [bacterium]|nr:hypothetical protein [bacterium]
MKKVISNKTIHFYDDKNNEIMYIDHSSDECIWYFYSDTIINVTEDMELYHLLDSFMNNYYDFNDEILPNYKDSNKLIWYSDCYYNPDDEWSIASVSCLNIERNNFCFKIWCTKKLDEMLDRPHKTYGICFSPAGNGKYSKILNTGLTLQDDFVTYIYQPLLNKNKVLKR